MNLVSLTPSELERLLKVFGYFTFVVSCIIFGLRYWFSDSFSLFHIWQAVASGLTVSVICFGFFSKMQWTSPKLARWLKRPVIHGLWRGTLNSNHATATNNPIEIFFVIKQTYMTLSIESFTRSQDGESKIEALIQNPKTDAFRVCYIFELKRTYSGENKLTTGSGDLKLIDGGKKLKGNYWTNSPTHGDIELSLITRTCSDIDCFESAESISNQSLS
jgi:hypothetical protein